MPDGKGDTSEESVEAAGAPTGSAEPGSGLPPDAGLFKTLFLGHPDGLVLVMKGRIALANDHFLEMSGYSTQEAIGMAPSELVVPEDRERLRDRIQDLDQGAMHPSRYTLLCKDGSRLPIDAHSSPIQHAGETGFISAFRDISKQRQAEDALRETAEKTLRDSEERFSKAFHDNPVPVAIARMDDGKLIDVNDALLSLFDYRRSEAIGHSAVELGVVVNPEAHDAAEAANREQEIVRDMPAQFQKENGEMLDLLVSTTNIEFDGEPCRLTTVVDITKRMRLEEKLQRLQDDVASKVERRMGSDNPYKLTFREFTVLHLVAEGKFDKEIATELEISVFTVHRHVSHILTKMHSRSRTEAGTRALREGLLD